MRKLESAGDIDIFGLCRQLQQADWDAFASDMTGEVAARRQPASGRGAWTLVIDRSGRWRFASTHALAASAGREEMRGGYPVRVQRETQQLLTVMGCLADPTDLSGLLAELAQLALEETDASTHRAEETAPWDEESPPKASLNTL